MTRREWLARFLRLAGATGIAPSLISCANSRQRRDLDNSTITVLYPDGALGPYDDMGAQALVFMPLVAWNRSGELEGRLAESWNHSPDFRTWTIRLRDGIRWHDGMPVTAHDMKFTLDLLTNPDSNLYAPGSYAAEVVDDLTYRITYHQQDLMDPGPLNDDLFCWPKHILEKLDTKEFDNWSFWSSPVGNGPYRHVQTVPHTMMEFEAHPDYLLRRRKIQKVILKLVSFGGVSAVPELMSGSVDAAVYSPPSDVINISRDPRFRAYETGFNAGTALWWNLNHPLFRESVVRQALTYAINRRELLQVLNLGPEVNLIDFLVTDRQRRRGEFPPALPYDSELANRLLDQAGWRRRDRAQLRERGGKPFQFDVLVVADQGVSSGTDVAVYVQSQLQHVGVQVDLLSMPYESITARMQAGNFAAAIKGFGTHELSRNLRDGGYANPAFFRMLDTAQTTFDPARKDELFRELTQIFQADLPVTFLNPLTSTTIASTRVRGLDGSPYRGDLTQCMDELWLEDRT